MNTSRTLESLSSSLAALFALALVPKCPLCVAAYLVSLGVGASAAQASAPFIRPAAWILMGLSVFALVRALWLSVARITRGSDRAARAAD